MGHRRGEAGKIGLVWAIGTVLSLFVHASVCVTVKKEGERMIEVRGGVERGKTPEGMSERVGKTKRVTEQVEERKQNQGNGIPSPLKFLSAPSL